MINITIKQPNSACITVECPAYDAALQVIATFLGVKPVEVVTPTKVRKVRKLETSRRKRIAKSDPWTSDEVRAAFDAFSRGFTKKEAMAIPALKNRTLAGIHMMYYRFKTKNYSDNMKESLRGLV